jgi:hypothetical protein
MDNLEALVVARDPQREDWGRSMPALTQCACALLGWRLRVDPIDDGEGLDPLIHLLGLALCASYTLTFLQQGSAPERGGWSATGDDAWELPLSRPEPLTTVLHRGRGVPPLSLISTRAPAMARRLFDPELWHNEAQIVLLTTAESVPPALGRRELRHFGRGTLSLAVVRAMPDGRGLMVPGHDGDWAVLSFLSPEWREKLLQSAARECSAAGKAWEEVTEAQFLPKLRSRRRPPTPGG